MRFKTVFAATTLLMSSVGLVFGSDVDSSVQLPITGTQALSDGVFPVARIKRQNTRPVLLAQAQSGQQLEEQIRLLNGKVEEMNFLVLQLQEQMRKMQEDNEFRFQELEKSKQGGAEPSDTRPKESQTKDNSNDVTAAPPVEANPKEMVDITPQPDAPADGVQTGAEPKALGTIEFDQDGKQVGATVEDVIQDTNVAATPAENSAGEVYRVAYDHVLAGEFADAESGFRKHIEKFPKDKQTADARYWLGESMAGQGKHREAAEILLDAQRDYPKAKKAPDMLLKLGVSLAALDNKDVACATFAQIAKKYPKAGPTLLSRVGEEQSKAGC
jgi:tol-pal system protein YbgF